MDTETLLIQPVTYLLEAPILTDFWINNFLINVASEK